MGCTIKLVYFICLFIYLGFFQDRVSLYSPGCPGTHFVDQAGLELRNPPASAFRVLGLKACATTARHLFIFKFKKNYIYLCIVCLSLCVSVSICLSVSMCVYMCACLSVGMCV
jgi:hypothetical protein